jgi:hypothetical protein
MKQTVPHALLPQLESEKYQLRLQPGLGRKVLAAVRKECSGFNSSRLSDPPVV